MKISELLNKFIEEYNENTPIFIKEIKEYFNNDKQVMSKVYVYINRMIKSGKLKTYCNGVYYKGNITKEDVIRKKYISDKEEVYGYYVGEYIVSNVCKKGTSYYNRTLGIKIKRPKIEITKENYKYLEVLDKLKNKLITKEESYEFIKNNNLNPIYIFEYAKSIKL